MINRTALQDTATAGMHWARSSVHRETEAPALTTVKNAQFVFFGALGAVAAGLADVIAAFFRNPYTQLNIGNLNAYLIGIGALVPFGVALGIVFALLSRRFSLSATFSKLKRPRNAALGLCGVALSAALLTYASYRRGILVDALDLRQPILVCILLGTLTGGVLLRTFKKYNFTKAATILVSVTFGITVSALIRVGETAGLPQFLTQNTALISPVFNVIRTGFDSDKDGFPRILCNTDCDCDDRDPGRNPAAVDIPGNNIDEDCSGSDLALPPPPPENQNAASAPSVVYPAAFSPPLNIVLITIDSLRADRLHVYGHNRETSPNLDRFGLENVRFDQVRSQGPSTRHVFPVFLTGQYFPTIRQEKGEKWWKLLDDNTTFAEILKQQGYRTVAVLPYFRFKENSGFQQGFDVWEPVLDSDRDSTWSPTGDLVTNRGIEHLHTLKKSDGPWLLWLHYFDPHASYVRHDDQPSFGNERADLYDGEVLYVDKQVGRFFEALKREGFFNTSAIIVTSDHGEGIGLDSDHGFNYHGFSLYDSETRVPFMMRAPGMSPRVVEQSVALMDLTPTLLTLGGADIPETMHGYSLIPYAFGSTAPRPPFLMHLPESKAWEAIVDWPYKLIWEKKPNRFQLFNLKTDPHEQHNLTDENNEVTQRLKDRLKLENYHLESSDGQPATK